MGAIHESSPKLNKEKGQEIKKAEHETMSNRRKESAAIRRVE
jgi:hypothetical protein